jgi:hypothetical protein
MPTPFQLYLAKGKKFKEPSSNVFPILKNDETLRIIRHLKLGTARIRFYDKQEKKVADKIDIFKPFMIQVQCRTKSNPGENYEYEFVTNNHMSRLIEKTYKFNPTGNTSMVNRVELICQSKGWIDEGKFFKEQIAAFADQDFSWFTNDQETIQNLTGNEQHDLSKQFYSKMENRYEKLTGNVFKLNPRILSILDTFKDNFDEKLFSYNSNKINKLILNDENYFQLTAKQFTDTIITNYWQTANIDSISLIEPVKPQPPSDTLINRVTSFISNQKSLALWNEQETYEEKLEIYENELEISEQVNEFYRYNLLPKIHSDWSYLAFLKLDELTTDQWIEIYKTNHDVETSLVPVETRKLFNQEQLKQILNIQPEIIVDWSMPELYTPELAKLYPYQLELQKIFPYLTHEQQHDIKIFSRFSYGERHLIPADIQNIDDDSELVFDRDDAYLYGVYLSSVDTIYERLSKILKTKYAQYVVTPENLSLIPLEALDDALTYQKISTTTYANSETDRFSWNEQNMRILDYANHQVMTHVKNTFTEQAFNRAIDVDEEVVLVNPYIDDEFMDTIESAGATILRKGTLAEISFYIYLDFDSHTRTNKKGADDIIHNRTLRKGNDWTEQTPFMKYMLGQELDFYDLEFTTQTYESDFEKIKLGMAEQYKAQIDDYIKAVINEHEINYGNKPTISKKELAKFYLINDEIVYYRMIELGLLKLRYKNTYIHVDKQNIENVERVKQYKRLATTLKPKEERKVKRNKI